MDRGAWQAIVHGVAKSRTQLSNRLKDQGRILSLQGFWQGAPKPCVLTDLGGGGTLSVGERNSKAKSTLGTPSPSFPESCNGSVREFPQFICDPALPCEVWTGPSSQALLSWYSPDTCPATDTADPRRRSAGGAQPQPAPAYIQGVSLELNLMLMIHP